MTATHCLSCLSTCGAGHCTVGTNWVAVDVSQLEDAGLSIVADLKDGKLVHSNVHELLKQQKKHWGAQTQLVQNLQTATSARKWVAVIDT